jgi:hypothetical protein
MKVVRWAVRLAVVAILSRVATGQEAEVAALRAHVARLASPEFAGRSGEGARKAEAYVTEAFRELGLEPLFDGSYAQDIPGLKPGEVIGHNVGARLVGSDPMLRDEWVILSAHYDHLGARDDRYFPGADDNASGVAMLLEVARWIVRSAERPRRSLMFVSFDLEEVGLLGSRHFVESPPVPLDRVKLFVTADLIGGALGGVCRPEVFVVGSEQIPSIRATVRSAAADLPGLKPAFIGADVLAISRSDYGPFRTRKVPFLFFSTGETPRYHTPRDTPESLDEPKLELISRLIGRTVRQAADAPTLPVWNVEADRPVEEAQALRDVVRTLLQHREELGVNVLGVRLMKSTLEQLDPIIERGVVTAEERARFVRSAQLILATVL